MSRDQVVTELVAAYSLAGTGASAATKAVLLLEAIELEYDPTEGERDEAKRRWRLVAASLAPGKRHLRVVRGAPWNNDA